MIIFADLDTANTVCKEITCTPSGVYLWYPPGATTNEIQYCASLDGRQAIGYPFSDDDAAWLQQQLQGQSGVQIMDALPDDWQWPVDN